MTTSTRRCKNWLQSYRDYILPRTDAPESFVFWSGLFTIAAVLRRRVVFPKRLLGLWECYPHMYLIFVGPAGIRKTTAIDSGAKPLLSMVDGVNMGPGFFTKEALLEKMQRSSDASIVLTIDELSSVLQKAGKEGSRSVFEFFTSMYDSPKVLESATKSSGTVFLEKPSMSFFTATTPVWITNNMPEDVINGGFGSRCYWVYEERPRIRKMFFDDVALDPELEANLLLDLLEISNLEGEFDWTPEAKARFKEWEQQEPPMALAKNDKLGGYLNRRNMLTLKLVMLHSVMKSNSLLIDVEDFEFGLWCMESIEPNLEKIFGGVGKNRYTTEIEKIVKYVRSMNFYTEKVVAKDDILTNFKHVAEPRVLNDLITFSVESKALRCKERWEGGKVEYDFWVPEWTDKLNGAG
jgi:hypothetical protein